MPTSEWRCPLTHQAKKPVQNLFACSSDWNRSGNSSRYLNVFMGASENRLTLLT